MYKTLYSTQRVVYTLFLGGYMFDCNGFLERKRLTQAQLARKIGCSQSAVAFWCNGATNPPYASMLKLISYGVTAEELFGKESGKTLLGNSKPVSADPSSMDFSDAVAKIVRRMKSEGEI